MQEIKTRMEESMRMSWLILRVQAAIEYLTDFAAEHRMPRQQVHSTSTYVMDWVRVF
jgi:hypothetical protein